MPRKDRSDPYADGTAAYWHLSRPSPELLQALDAGRLRPEMGFRVAGVDLSAEAIRQVKA